MIKPRLLDLFCRAGGAAMGYHRAGFEVVGVDIKPQPHYPFEFHQADAFTYPLEGFDAYHASPLCQKWTWASKRWHKEWPDQITPIRQKLLNLLKPFIIENVPFSPLKNPLILKGTMFGLKVIRKRWFELHGFNIWFLPSPVLPKSPVKSGQYQTVAGHGGNSKDCRLSTWQEAMGIDWMDNQELTQAIPPAYTEYIGRYLMQAIRDDRG